MIVKKRSVSVMAPKVADLVQRVCRMVSTVLPADRVRHSVWVLLELDVSDGRDWDSDLDLQVADDALIEELAAHPDSESGQVPGSLRWWEIGFRGLYYWRAEDQLVCSQFLVTEKDRPTLARLGEWRGLYPPLADDVGRVEHLHTYSGHRRRGAASQFGRAMARVAHRQRLQTLVTHIGQSNAPALGWARKMGWVEVGTIDQWNLDLRGLRNYSLYVHSRY